MTKREMNIIKTDMEDFGFTEIVTIHATLKTGKKTWMISGRSPRSTLVHLFKDFEQWSITRPYHATPQMTGVALDNSRG